MQAVIWIGRIVLMLVLVWFAVKNAQPVTLYGVLDYNWQAPLVLILLMFFIGGALFGVLAAFGTVFRLKRQLAQVRKQLKKAEADLALRAPVGPVGQASITPTTASPAAASTHATPPHGD
jgi:lipopolysaccharide assembly protein A